MSEFLGERARLAMAQTLLDAYRAVEQVSPSEQIRQLVEHRLQSLCLLTTTTGLAVSPRDIATAVADLEPGADAAWVLAEHLGWVDEPPAEQLRRSA